MYQDAGSGAAAPKKKSGCLKWGGIGCGVLFLLIIILAVGAWTQRHKFMEWAGEKMRAEILKALPEDFNQAEATEVMESFWNALKEDKVTEADVKQLTTRFQTAFQDGELSNEEAEELLNFMREKVGLDVPADMEEPREEGWEDDEAAGEAEATADGATEL